MRSAIPASLSPPSFGRSQSPISSNAFGSPPNTLTELVWDTMKIDLGRIVSNLKLVVFPNPFREDPGKALRDWELWGPFFFIVFLGLVLFWSASVKKEILKKAEEIFGPDNKDLYLSFQGLISINAH